ncbi:50S ribosomal protein L25 [Candidatus Uhrbacteria bacterium CG10_big_fil_rev_8_21_14_0_10_48_16]|uniref:Large ribosomal subunit protein bL25 n=1 Tax=Candidatus Uhrbacteria bacterium CG10_big_fil_rev_8_21_14_0_10_48_16 TaxID=1975038 RepID=A0A2M8LFW2_9BACT|nr:MAG: 50S ribosomal protein L25 [Candidatus Uhrbacteria bacterium CG10_big_fil_rev_8_21_14_0_10_48_16]
MSINTLEAKTRTEIGRKANVLRAQGAVPAVVYGVGTQPQMLTLDRIQFVKIYKAAGESSIVELKVDGENALHVLIQDYQVDPIRNEVTHVDFRSIDMNKAIETEVTLEIVGEAPAVKALGGTLTLSRESIAISCLPAHLLRSLAVDVSSLATFDDVLRVSDLVIPEGVTVLDDPELSIASVIPPRTDAEMDALDASTEVDVAAVESADVKKDEGEEEKEEDKK